MTRIGVVPVRSPSGSSPSAPAVPSGRSGCSQVLDRRAELAAVAEVVLDPLGEVVDREVDARP